MKKYQVSSPQDKSPQFQYYNNFSKVLFAGKWYHLGIMQAKVIKQLYYASLTDSPWIFGKELLYKAGSESIRMRDLFKSQSGWKEIIESDHKGNYRLKFPKNIG